jgi:hypothetical protein
MAQDPTIIGPAADALYPQGEGHITGGETLRSDDLNFQYPQANWKRALWLACSATIANATIDAADTFVVYGVTFTVQSVGAGTKGMIQLTDSNGFGYSIPNYVPDQLATAQSAGQQPLPNY